jgi:hypothetical protein
MRASATLVIFLLSAVACAQESARVEGTVRDASSGKAIPGALVEIYKVGGNNRPINLTVTDDSGYYSFFVEPMAFYSVYVRFGGASDSFKTPEAVRPGSVNKVNMVIRTSDNSMFSIVDQAGLGIVVFASLIVLGLVVFGFIRQNRRGETLNDLKREREQIKAELELLRRKYHRREIGEEQLNAISKDKQQRLIELESKMIKQLNREK